MYLTDAHNRNNNKEGEQQRFKTATHQQVGSEKQHLKNGKRIILSGQKRIFQMNIQAIHP